jgi:hypothetical protein
MALSNGTDRRVRYRSSLDFIMDEPCCENCGSPLHKTARCRNRDDAVMGTASPGRNGEYTGPLPVRHLPPGFSFTENPFAVVGSAKPAPGQVWRSPNGMLFAIHAIESGVVIIRRTSSNGASTPGFPRVPLLRFKARYRFVRAR